MAGDLYVTIHVLPHAFLERRGDDIWYKLEIPFSIAVLGGKIEVSTLGEKVKIKIPAGTQNGKIFRLKGEGVKRLEGYGRGDEMVEVTVRVPKSLSREQRKMLRELEKEGL